jgi:formylglycine-generating enzyme required for sulfatase activity
MMRSLILVLLLLTTNGVMARQVSDTFTAYTYTFPGSEIKFTMQAIPGGVFEWGSTGNDKAAEEDERPARRVKLDPFWMGAHEVTFDEFNLFFNDIELSQNIPTDGLTRPSSPYIDMTLGMGKAGGFPANSMQQYGAIMYCRWLYQKTGIFYRLPTEAEWEYACRAGSSSVYPFGDSKDALVDYAWYAANSDGRYHKVGLKKPNAWGLYDMLGNVAEWVLDQYDASYYEQLADSINHNPVRLPESKHPRSVKGGSYKDEATALRPADRLKSDLVWNRRDPQIPKSRWWNADAPFVGFRIVRPLEQPDEATIKNFFETYLGF